MSIKRAPVLAARHKAPIKNYAVLLDGVTVGKDIWAYDEMVALGLAKAALKKAGVSCLEIHIEQTEKPWDKSKEASPGPHCEGDYALPAPLAGVVASLRRHLADIEELVRDLRAELLDGALLTMPGVTILPKDKK